MRRVALIGCAAASLLGGCAQAMPPPAATAPPARGYHAVAPMPGVDCTTRNYGLFTTSTCGDGGFRIRAPATE